MKITNLITVVSLAIGATLASCNGSEDSAATGEGVNNQDTMTTNAQVPSTPQRLFDGVSFNGWHGFNKTGPVANWAIEDSALVCLGAAKDAHGGDLVSDREFENFELAWEWKVTTGGNSGVMYHVIESPKYQAPYETGPEYQMIDDIGFPAKLEDWQKSGADYAMSVPNEKKKLKPVGEWNTSKIIYNKGHVEHWLNNEQILTFEVGNEQWMKEKTAGKWKDYPDYAAIKKGKIALQDHGNKVYFKNIVITEL